MEIVDIRIGGITFKASDEWIFHPTENFILARHDAQKGILKILVGEMESQESSSSEELLKAASRFLSREENLELLEDDLYQEGDIFFGSANYSVIKENKKFFTRIWYVVQGKNMVVATYGCPWEIRGDAAVQEELRQCEDMMKTVQFSTTQETMS